VIGIDDLNSLNNGVIPLLNKKNVRQKSLFTPSLLSDYILSSTYEVINKNLRSYPYTLTYSSGNVSVITYDIGGGMSIVKTFSYTTGKLTSIVLSGDLPIEIDYLTKTLSYTGSNLTSVSYS
jgi:hypothetical protein